MGFGQGSEILVRPPLLSFSRRFLSEWDQEGDVPRSLGYNHTWNKTAGSLPLSVFSAKWSGSTLWPVISGLKQIRCRNPSQIIHSLVSTELVGDLPEQVLCPVRTVRYLRWADRSAEFTPSRNLWHLRDCSFFELYSIFPFLPSRRQLHGCLLVCSPWDALQTCLPPDHDLQMWVLWSLLCRMSSTFG